MKTIRTLVVVFLSGVLGSSCSAGSGSSGSPGLACDRLRDGEASYDAALPSQFPSQFPLPAGGDIQTADVTADGGSHIMMFFSRDRYSDDEMDQFYSTHLKDHCWTNIRRSTAEPDAPVVYFFSGFGFDGTVKPYANTTLQVVVEVSLTPK